MTITSGKYKARLFDAVKYKTPKGHDAIRFVWDLCGLGQRTTSTHAPLDSEGHTEIMSSYGTCAWAKDWNGRDLDWFSNQLKSGATFNVWLCITDGMVDLVLPRSEEVVYSNVPTVIKLEVDRDVLLRLPETIEPNAENAKALYDAMTEKTDREDANLVWTLMAEKIGPMQIDFKAEQWAQMIEKIKGLSSCSFVMREGRR